MSAKYWKDSPEKVRGYIPGSTAPLPASGRSTPVSETLRMPFIKQSLGASQRVANEAFPERFGTLPETAEQ
jgi:hypothetical protein